jgi:hypothetical protein
LPGAPPAQPALPQSTFIHARGPETRVWDHGGTLAPQSHPMDYILVCLCLSGDVSSGASNGWRRGVQLSPAPRASQPCRPHASRSGPAASPGSLLKTARPLLCTPQSCSQALLHPVHRSLEPWNLDTSTPCSGSRLLSCPGCDARAIRLRCLVPPVLTLPTLPQSHSHLIIAPRQFPLEIGFLFLFIFLLSCLV